MLPTSTGGSDLVLTLEQTVMHGVIPSELATAAAQTFGWDWSYVITEGTFLELFVPVDPNDYHSLDFMRNFRRAWLLVNESYDDSASAVATPHMAGEEKSWLFEEEGLVVDDVGAHLPRLGLAARLPPSRPSSAPPAPMYRESAHAGESARAAMVPMEDVALEVAEHKDDVVQEGSQVFGRSQSSGALLNAHAAVASADCADSALQLAEQCVEPSACKPTDFTTYSTVAATEQRCADSLQDGCATLHGASCRDATQVSMVGLPLDAAAEAPGPPPVGMYDVALAEYSSMACGSVAESMADNSAAPRGFDASALAQEMPLSIGSDAPQVHAAGVGIGGASIGSMGSADPRPRCHSPAAKSACSYTDDTFEEFSDGGGSHEPRGTAPELVGSFNGGSIQEEVGLSANAGLGPEIAEEVSFSANAGLGMEIAEESDVEYADMVRRSAPPSAATSMSYFVDADG